ncbi:MAG: DUF4145 domain-containing protein [Sphingobacteriaceae bacterium]|nr:DUF4145 domain-containing protein [Sphingobacteriaceae bacterium]
MIKLEEDAQLRNYCNECYKETNHKVVSIRTIEGDHEYRVESNYMILKCCGCDNLSYRTEVRDYEDMREDDNGEWQPHSNIETYPQYIPRHREIQTFYLPRQLKIIYKEAIDCYAAGCLILAGAAFRALIEAICKAHDIKGRDLQAQIINMVKAKLITQKEGARMHAIRFLGNDSIHELKKPSKESLKIVLNIIDHLLNNLYIIDNEIAEEKIETVISSYSTFRELLEDFLIFKFEINDSYSIRGFFGKLHRRIQEKLPDFEAELKAEIASGKFDFLKIDAMKPKLKEQTYTLIKKPDFR